MLFVALALFLSFIVIFWPKFGIICMLFLWGTIYQLIPEQTQFIFAGIEITPSRILGVALTVALMITTLIRLPRIRWSSSMIVLLVFSVWCLITILFATHKPEALSLYIRFLSGFFLYTSVAVIFNTPENIRKLFKWMVITGGIAAITAVYDYASKTGVSFFPTIVCREKGIFGAPGGTATLFLVLIFFIFVIWTQIKTFYGKLFLASIFLLLSLGIFITLTRASILGLFIMLLFWGHGRYKSTRSPGTLVLWILIPVSITIIGLSFVGFKALTERTKDIPIIGQVKITDPQAGMGRIGLWKTNIEKLKKASILTIFFGSGLSDSQFRKEGGRVIKGEFTHNDFLFLLLDTGLIGLGLYICWIILMLKHSRELYIKSNISLLKNIGLASKCLILGYTAVGFFGLTLFVTAHRWYYMTALGCVEAIIMQLEFWSQIDFKKIS